MNETIAIACRSGDGPLQRFEVLGVSVSKAWAVTEFGPPKDRTYHVTHKPTGLALRESFRRFSDARALAQVAAEIWDDPNETQAPAKVRKALKEAGLDLLERIERARLDSLTTVEVSEEFKAAFRAEAERLVAVFEGLSVGTSVVAGGEEWVVDADGLVADGEHFPETPAELAAIVLSRWSGPGEPSRG